MAKRIFASLLACTLLLTFFAAIPSFAESETFLCYFEESKFMRQEPCAGDNIKTIPRYTPVYITPVSEKYAAVTYDGVSGYVYYIGFKDFSSIKDMSAIMFSEGNKYVFEYPLPDSLQIDTIPVETPVFITADAGSYYRISSGGYIHKRDMQEIPEDYSITPIEVFSRTEVPVRKYPIKGAEVICNLEPNQVYVAQEKCRTFYKLTCGEKTGYVLTTDVSSFAKDNAQTRAGIISQGAQLYEKPDALFPGEINSDTGVHIIDGNNGNFCHIQDLNLYCSIDDLQSWAITKIPVEQLYPAKEIYLQQTPTEDSAPLNYLITKDQLCQAFYAVGDYYLISADGNLGFMKKNVAARITPGDKMDRTAAFTVCDTVIFTDEGISHKVKAGSKVFISRMAEDFYICTADNVSGYILADDVKIVGSDAPVDEYQVHAAKDTTVHDFPDEKLWSETADIKAGATVTVKGFNRCYLVTDEGYIRQDGFLSPETEGIPTSENVPAYELVLDKSTRMAYAFVLDENGERTDTVAASSQVAIGKRTTPTPSGTFALLSKERWHKFKYSVTPHTTKYTRGKFIHGFPCEERSESTILNYMAHQSGFAVTGGCLRCPFEFARWVYFNCPSYTTVLEIVNGGINVPREEKTE